MGDEHLIIETPHARVEQCLQCPIPGYLIVSAESPSRSLSEIPSNIWKDVSDALYAACRIVEKVIVPERVYICRFGEEISELHFHVFPRTKELLDKYKKAIGTAASPISGPLLFDWARETYGKGKTSDPPGLDLQEALRRMKKEAHDIFGKKDETATDP